MSRRAVLVLLSLLLLCLSLRCRQAAGTARDPLAAEAEDALVAYLRIDTSNPPGNETAGAAFLRDHLARAGITARLIGEDPKRQGLYARLEAGPASTKKALLLVSHIDVVPTNAALWTQPPFSGARSGGYIWGRGALDAKSLTIAQLMALVDLKRRAVRLDRDVIFLALPDEELGGVRGAKWILEKHPELFENAGFAINEGGANQTAVDRILHWGIEVQQKVPLWLRLTAEAPGGHASGPPEGGGAPARLVRALAALETIETPYRVTPSVARAVASEAAQGGVKGRRLQLVREPLDVPRLEREIPPRIRNVLRDTITVTRLEAGSAVNILPAKAVAEVDVRLLPDSEAAPMLERIRQAVGRHASVDVIHAGQPAPESPPAGELYEAIASVMRKAEPGSAVGPIVSAGATDSRYFRAHGIVTYGVMPFKVNYYDADSIHAEDERIRAAFFADGVLLMRDIVRNFCEAR